MNAVYEGFVQTLNLGANTEGLKKKIHFNGMEALAGKSDGPGTKSWLCYSLAL